MEIRIQRSIIAIGPHLQGLLLLMQLSDTAYSMEDAYLTVSLQTYHSARGSHLQGFLLLVQLLQLLHQLRKRGARCRLLLPALLSNRGVRLQTRKATQ
jgi:hypothetical protein